MTSLGWILVVIGAIINFLTKPLSERVLKRELPEKVLYLIKTAGMCLVILGAVMIFVSGGKVDVRAVR
ncbi:MAG: hypothetical protein IJO50_04605 [Clostridia bacterium]|nr:hypothetical protein [Clostridia bacterium]